MDYRMDGDELIICPAGRIETVNAEAVEREINSVRNASSHNKIALDLGQVEYISSSGLRVILRLKKQEKTLRLINVSAEVYEVLDMTGFTEMLPVEKSMRVLDVTGCEVIGEGSNGIVYRYTDDIIVKVYKNADALDDIQRERELARKALVLGVNTAIPYDVVKVGNTYGSVFELLSAKSLSKLIISDPANTDKYLGVFAQMLREIHATEVPGNLLPDIKKVYLGYAEFLKPYLSAAHYEKLVRMVKEVPDSKHMIHGDYHTNNVHYANGEAILIDMDTLATGDPIFEFASIFLAYRGFNMMDPNASLKFFKINAEDGKKIFEKLLRDYFETEDEKLLAELDDRISLLGLVRLLRRTIRRDSENTAGIEMLKTELTARLERVDRLSLAE